jgi:hypothetical protein
MHMWFSPERRFVFHDSNSVQLHATFKRVRPSELAVPLAIVTRGPFPLDSCWLQLSERTYAIYSPTLRLVVAFATIARNGFSGMKGRGFKLVQGAWMFGISFVTDTFGKVSGQGALPLASHISCYLERRKMNIPPVPLLLTRLCVFCRKTDWSLVLR